LLIPDEGTSLHLYLCTIEDLHMLKSLALGASALVMCGSLSAQTTNYVELPKGYTKTVDKLYDYYLLCRSSYWPMHVQYCYDLADIPTGSPIIKELAWRRNNYYSNTVPAGTVTLTVTMGHSANLPSAMSTTFANNIISTSKQVFKGTLNFPAAPKGTGPAPWTHMVKLAAPGHILALGGNKSLTVDIVITATTGYTGTHPMEVSGPDGGGRSTNGSIYSLCKFSNGKYNSGLGYTTSGLTNAGGTWYVNYSSILPNAVGLVTLSGFGIDNKGKWPLPIDLTNLLGAPNCKWNVGLETALWIPVTANASGSARLPNITIPPGFGGSAFYDHSLWFDKAANKGGVVVGWSSKWYIGTGKGPSANTLYRTADKTASATGYLRKGYGMHLRLTR
jgi:hypothetical protein